MKGKVNVQDAAILQEFFHPVEEFDEPHRLEVINDEFEIFGLGEDAEEELREITAEVSAVAADIITDQPKFAVAFFKAFPELCHDLGNGLTFHISLGRLDRAERALSKTALRYYDRKIFVIHHSCFEHVMKRLKPAAQLVFHREVVRS